MDDLKELWQVEQEKIEAKNPRINLSEDSGSLIGKMRKNLFYEDVFNKCVGVFSFLFLMYLQSYLLSMAIAVIFIPTLLYYRYILKMIDDFSYETDVKLYLKNVYRLLKTFVFRYRLAGIIILPFSFVYGFYLGIEPDESFEITIQILLISISSILGLYGLIEVYIYFLYGKKLGQLKTLIQQIDEQ